MRILPGLLVVLLAVGACGGSSTPTPSPTSESPSATASLSPSPTSTDTYAPPSVEPRDLLGIHFDDNASLARDGYIVPAPCASGLETWQDSSFIPEAPPYIAAGGFEPETAPGLEPLPNPGALVCPDDGKPYTAWRYYNFPFPGNGPTPALNIIHFFEERPSFQIGSWDYVQVTTLAGRDVIEIANYLVIIPTDDGYILFQGEAGFPFEEVRNMAASYLGGGPTPIAAE